MDCLHHSLSGFTVSIQRKSRTTRSPLTTSERIIDSYVIADFARVGRIAIKPWRGSQYLALQRLTRHRMHITECIAREKTYMLNNIYLKFSEYALLRDGQHPFANKYGATAEAILTEYTTNEDIVNSSAEDLVAFINSKSKDQIAFKFEFWYLNVNHTDISIYPHI